MKKLLPLLLMLFVFHCQQTVAQCEEGQSELIIRIVPDSYPWETSWNVTVDGNTIATGTTVGDTICVDNGSCVQVRIIDSYGDGIFSPGGYWVYLNGELQATGNSFGSLAEVSVACPPGSACSSPVDLSTGQYTATFEDTWYKFSCTQSGTYSLSSCGLSGGCDTKFWVFESCPIVGLTEGPMGTYAFNDNADCGLESELSVVFVEGFDYLIRVGDNEGACEGDITFNFSYVGAIQGCTDPASCNYNPLAEIDNGSCIYFPDPACQGPDLAFDSLSFVNSLALGTHNAAGCDIDEDCVTGYGLRYVIRFTSKIDNIGTSDYYLGNPSDNPSSFNTVNCHGHTHYEGYGDYRLYDDEGNIVPAGHKNGFCVMDLCGFGQYNCGNMGISAGCYDVYGSGTQCQWIDITDVPAGDYRLAVIINSMHLPDALGRHEINYLNNALQVCIRITRNAANIPSYEIIDGCEPFVDCAGIPGGVSIRDCNGECDGSGMFGNTVEDEVVNMDDVEEYIEIITADQVQVMPCYDLNGDGEITVYDTALELWCMNSANQSGDLSNCYFPRNILNPMDTTYLEIIGVDYVNNYLDISLFAERADVVGYQFNISGIVISDVAPLTNPADMPIHLSFNQGRNEVAGVYYGDSAIVHSTSQVNLVRVYFSSITGEPICISNITDIPNIDGETTVALTAGDCFMPDVTAVSPIAERAHLTVLPNPAKNQVWVNLPSTFGKVEVCELFDATGRFVEGIVPSAGASTNQISLSLSGISNGIYMLRIADDQGRNAIGRIVKQ